MGTHPIFESDFDCLTDMGKRKGYKQFYGGAGGDISKKCKYSNNAIHNIDESTRGYLLSYRRNCLKQATRESFSIVKHFSHLLYPEVIDENGDEVSERTESAAREDDIESQLLAEAKEAENKKRIFNIYETGVSQTLFMEAKGAFDTPKVTDKLWACILDGTVHQSVLPPRHLERLLPISHVCEATKETISETVSRMIEIRFKQLDEPAEYYVMPRVRFHSSLDRDILLEIVKEKMKELRPGCQLNWKQTKCVIFVEVLKRRCYLSVFRDWNERQKYNWQEFHKRQSQAKSGPNKVETLCKKSELSESEIQIESDIKEAADVRYDVDENC